MLQETMFFVSVDCGYLQCCHLDVGEYLQCCLCTVTVENVIFAIEKVEFPSLCEVEFTTGHYGEAYNSYRDALKLKPDDINLLEALNKTAKEILREREADKKIPWVGAGIGIVVGVVIVIADCLFTYKPTHPMLMALITMVIALVGYGIARSYRTYIKFQRNGLLDPPADLVKEMNKNEENDDAEKDVKRTPRYTKSQARQRYKKGKL